MNPGTYTLAVCAQVWTKNRRSFSPDAGAHQSIRISLSSGTLSITRGQISSVGVCIALAGTPARSRSRSPAPWV
jgi:hypothetical protein